MIKEIDSFIKINTKHPVIVFTKTFEEYLGLTEEMINLYCFDSRGGYNSEGWQMYANILTTDDTLESSQLRLVDTVLENHKKKIVQFLFYNDTIDKGEIYDKIRRSITEDFQHGNSLQHFINKGA